MFQLKMRTGGMDPSRKYKKKSPKHKSSKKQTSHHHHSHSQAPSKSSSLPAVSEPQDISNQTESDTGFSTPGNTPPTNSQQPEQPQQPTAQPEDPQQQQRAADEALELVEQGGLIATTPVSGGNRTLVDIHEGFAEEHDPAEDMECIDGAPESSGSLVTLEGLTKVTLL
jgi:hypothetical protein